MAIRRFSSGSEYEDKIGYSRAVVAGGVVYVSGTVAPGDPVSPDVAEQCRAALDLIEAVLARADCALSDVVRVTYMLPDRNDFAACWPVLADAFGEARPAATMIECGLIDPKYRIEIEVTALAPQNVV